MKIKLPCTAVYVSKTKDCQLNYGMEVNVADFFPLTNDYDIEREGEYYCASPKELYFPDLNTYNQPCFKD